MSIIQRTGHVFIRRIGVVVTAVAVIAGLMSTAGATASPGSSPSAGHPGVEITAPVPDEPAEAAAGESVTVSFSTNRAWPFVVDVRASSTDGDWQPFADNTGRGTAHDGHNDVELRLPELADGDYDLRVRLFTPNANPDRHRPMAEADVEAGLRVTSDAAEVFTTDFKEDGQVVGEMPAGWSVLWGDGAGFEIADAPRRVVHTNTSGGQESIVLDAPGMIDFDLDAEVAGLVRLPAEANPAGTSTRFQMHMQASGEPGSHSSFYTDTTATTVRLGRYRDGSYTNRGTAYQYEVPADAWHHVVMQRHDDVWRTKMWPYGTAEPADWMVETNRTSLDGEVPAGQPGIGHFAAGAVQEWAWFSVAVGTDADLVVAERAPEGLFEPEPGAEVTAVQVEPESISLGVGVSAELTATAVYDDGAAVDVTQSADWASADDDVATVPAGGVVTGVSGGTVEVTATFEDVTGAATVTVDADAHVYTTNFKEDTHIAGEWPDGWSEFRVTGDWSVQNAPRRLVGEISGGRQGVRWETPGDDGVIEGDVEVAGLVRTNLPAGNALFQIVLHGAEHGTDDYYYVDARLGSNAIRINRFLAGSFNVLRSAPSGVQVDSDVWYQVVFRREGNGLAAKMWPFGEDEPDEWQVSAVDTTHQSGQVGVAHLNTGATTDWAWFSAASGGLEAERAPEDVFDPAPDAQLSEVEITPSTIAIEAGDTRALQATAMYDDGAGVDVTATADWASDDEAIATVDSDGVVTAHVPGDTQVSATYAGMTDTADVSVVDFLAPTTGFEDRDGAGWTTLEEELEFLQEVADRSERMSFEQVGETVEGRPLHLVRVGYPVAPSDEEIADGQSALVVASQHGNEPAGREGALRHLRDVAFSEDPEVVAQLEDITMLYIPTANPDARAANVRTNADGIDTNRDHHLLETPEAATVAELVMRFDPEIVLDLHERPSGSEPDMELLWPRNLNVDEQLRELNIELVEDHLFPALEDEGFTVGLYGSPGGTGGGDERISRNVFGLRHKIALLTETAGQDPPMYRVESQTVTVAETLAFFHDRLGDVVEQTSDAPERRRAHGAGQGAFYLEGRDDVSPPPAGGIIDPGVCGYVVSAEQAESIDRHVGLFGIEIDTLDDGRVFIGMNQPMMTIIPFLVDPRATYNVAVGTAVDDCDDIPGPAEPAQFATSFTEPEHTVGLPPHGWSEYRAASEWAIDDLPRRLVGQNTGSRQGLMWDAPGPGGVVEGDVEVSGLVRAPNSGAAAFQLTLQASGDGTDYYYVDARTTTHTIRINRFRDNSFSVLQSEPSGFEVDNGVWYQVVFRREGDELAAKMWPFGEDEPDDWQVTTADTSHNSGQVGVNTLFNGTVNEWAWFAVATGGLEAERAPDGVLEPGADAELDRVELAPLAPIGKPGDTVELTATAVWDDGNGYDVTTAADWSSADEDVATVTGAGEVTAVDEGTAEISAVYEGVSGTVPFTVDEEYVHTGDGSHTFGAGQVTTSEGGMVSSADGLASEAGARMLADGGNAVDAATATAFALAVVEPSMSHLGGRAQMLIRLEDGEYVGIDGGTQVPIDYDPALAPPSHEAGRGYGAIATPGMVAALMQAHEEHGSMPLAEVMAPAIELAAEGFVLPPRQATNLVPFANVNDEQYAAAQRYFLRPDGTPYQAGDTLVQEDLASVLEAIANEGAGVFYDGWIADAIAADMEEFGGFVNSDELASYEALPSIVVDGSYHDYDLYSVYDPARGHVTIQALQMLEHFDMAQCAPGAGWLSMIHQAFRISMSDRGLDAGSPEASAERLTSKEFAADRAQAISDHCDPDSGAGPLVAPFGFEPGAGDGGVDSTEGDASQSEQDDAWRDWPYIDDLDPDEESPDTTHLSTADPAGMAVTLTQTIGPGNGSMVATEGLGFLYASTMGYSSAAPGARNSTNLTPMIVERDGELAYVLGAAGGGRIPTAVLLTLARTFDQDLSFAEAMAAPRFHSTAMGTIRPEQDDRADVYWPQSTVDGLGDLGYSLVFEGGQNYGRVHGLHYDADTGVFTGVADPRREGQAARLP
ncbi:gamma-glutamyltransferase [Phytoactinopolyspora limicola]|uniref:gamma-glutamyltransferase n=1 Tax=Phytoactinopolyspora limicola TaxID=2715536 RepID=UPI0014081A33|nr:gamma-glutamyltransferase [Phytoactinopolyspora limicola]